MSKRSSIPPPSRLQLLRLRLKAIWTEQWTSFLGWTKVVAGASGAAVATVGQLLNDGNVKAAIEALHLDPKIMLGLAILGVLTLMSMEHK